MKVAVISGFYRRYKCATRIIRMYLLQDYKGPSILLLYNNGPEIYELSKIELPDNKQIILINNNKELSTGDAYSNTGTIFQDALTFIPDGVEVCNFMDVDDFYSPQHISNGVKGYKEALKQNKLAYKPYYNWFKYAGEKVRLEHNTHEPSWFVNKEYLLEKGMFPVTASYHMKWIDPLRENGVYQPEDAPTFLYWWGGDDGVYKTSSKGDGEDSFKELRKWEQDGGVRVLFPCSEEEIQKYYNLVGWDI